MWSMLGDAPWKEAHKANAAAAKGIKKIAATVRKEEACVGKQAGKMGDLQQLE